MLDEAPLIWKVLAPDDLDAYEHARKRQETDGFLRKLFRRASSSVPAASELEITDGEGVDTDLDKSWHAIHYMLTGSAEESDGPLGFLLSGGRQVGDIDVGYGPARVFTSKQVQALHGFLQEIDESLLKKRFDPAEMMKLRIYPEIWDRNPAEEDNFEYCAEYFAVLQGFVAEAAKRNLGLVLYLA